MRFAPLLILVVACSIAPTATPSTAVPATASPPATTAVTTASPAAPSTGDLGDVVVRMVTVDGVELWVAVAATGEERSQGLRAVDDLGDLDGMLFTWGGEEVTSRFTMAGTLIELDIAFFDSEGAFVDGFRMTPCGGEDCPTYEAAAPYFYALETPAGTAPSVGPGSVLDLGE